MSITKNSPPFGSETIQRSLQLITPELLYSNFLGTKFIKRDIIKWNLVDNDVTVQPRRLEEDPEHAAELRIHKENHGEELHHPPKVVMVNPKSPGRYTLVSGYNRRKAEEQMGWKEGIFDILEFETPKRVKQAASWCNISHAPSKRLSKQDVQKSMLAVLHDKEVEADINNMVAYAQETWGEQFSEDILRTLSIRALGEAGINPTTMKEYEGRTAALAMDAIGCAVSGKFDNTINKYVFINKDGDSKTTYFNTMAKVMEDSSYRVAVFGYIEKPTHSNLKTRRQKWLDDFNSLNEIFYGHVALMLDVTMQEAKSMSKFNPPWEFGGFLPQDVTKSPKKGGLATEEGIVDVNGQPFGAFGIERGVFINQRKVA